jgi:hypothetical protein
VQSKSYILEDLLEPNFLFSGKDRAQASFLVRLVVILLHGKQTSTPEERLQSL